jgi:hypothetical protein
MLPPAVRIYVARDGVDMRKSFAAPPRTHSRS